MTSSSKGDVGGAIIVFAKCPIKGKSKTRLTPLLGSDGAALLAKAMLSDIISSLSECTILNNTLKVLVYAPGTSEGESIMVSILQSLDINYHTGCGYHKLSITRGSPARCLGSYANETI